MLLHSSEYFRVLVQTHACSALEVQHSTDLILFHVTMVVGWCDYKDLMKFKLVFKIQTADQRGKKICML